MRSTLYNPKSTTLSQSFGLSCLTFKGLTAAGSKPPLNHHQTPPITS